MERSAGLHRPAERRSISLHLVSISMIAVRLLNRTFVHTPKSLMPPLGGTCQKTDEVGHVVLSLMKTNDFYDETAEQDEGFDVSAYDLRRSELRRVGAVMIGHHSLELVTNGLAAFEFPLPVVVLTHRAPRDVGGGAAPVCVQSAVTRERLAERDGDVATIGSTPSLLGDRLRFFEYPRLASAREDWPTFDHRPAGPANQFRVIRPTIHFKPSTGGRFRSGRIVDRSPRRITCRESI